MNLNKKLIIFNFIYIFILYFIHLVRHYFVQGIFQLESLSQNYNKYLLILLIFSKLNEIFKFIKVIIKLHSNVINTNLVESILNT